MLRSNGQAFLARMNKESLLTGNSSGNLGAKQGQVLTGVPCSSRQQTLSQCGPARVMEKLPSWRLCLDVIHQTVPDTPEQRPARPGQAMPVKADDDTTRHDKSYCVHSTMIARSRANNGT